MRKIIFILMAALCLTACNNDEDDVNSYSPPSTATRSVIVYMAGNNNLTNHDNYHFLNEDMKEMIEGSKLLADNQRLFVYVDSLGSYKNDVKAAIVELHGGKTYTRLEFTEEHYAADPARFHEVLKWMTDNAKAESYGLVLWGHANGWSVDTDTIAQTTSKVSRAYGLDYGESLKEGTKFMNITQMARALEGLPKMEFIFADCCNMMCVEVGYELRNGTNYLIGSPAEIPGDGAPYAKIVPHFYRSGSDLYRNIIDTYYNYYKEAFQTDSELKGYSVPLSVIDTHHIEELALKTHDVLDQFNEPYPVYPKSPELYGTVFYLNYEAPVMYDMRAFIKTNTSDEVFQQWENVYKLAVPYYRMSMKWMTVYFRQEYYFPTFNKDETVNGCVSMFIPLNTSGYYNGQMRYNYTFNNLGWNRVINWSRYGWDENVTYRQ